jgi:hypothetical protein
MRRLTAVREAGRGTAAELEMSPADAPPADDAMTDGRFDSVSRPAGP